MGSQECYGWDTELSEPDDPPRAFDEDEVSRRWSSDVMEAVEQVVLGQPWREDPLAPLLHSPGVDPTTGIAERASLGVVQPHGDAALQHASTAVGADLEEPGDIGVDPLTLEHGRFGVER